MTDRGWLLLGLKFCTAIVVIVNDMNGLAVLLDFESGILFCQRIVYGSVYK